jgi:hypothetical protein
MESKEFCDMWAKGIGLTQHKKETSKIHWAKKEQSNLTCR